MKYLTIIFIVFLFSFCCNIQKQVLIDTKISDGYYYGNDKLFTNVFVKVAGDTALIDFILFQKYPRELLSDTLLYYASNHMFSGRTTNILLKNGRNYICTNQESMVFDKKVEIKLKPNETYYKKHINEYKNYAVWHQCYKEYLMNNDNKDDARMYFQVQSKKKNIKSMLDTYSHKYFLKELDKFKSELKYFK